METTTHTVGNEELFAALAQAQGKFEPIVKNRTVQIRSEKGSYTFRYADLEEITTKTRPALAAHGLALFQHTVDSGNGTLLYCTLGHRSGASIHSSIQIGRADGLRDPKAFGAQVTYFRRYLVTALLGVAADDDLDEDGEGMDAEYSAPVGRSSKPAVTTPQRRPQAAPATQPTETSDALATAGEVAYLTRKLSEVANAAEICNAHGVAHDLSGLTKSQFSAIKGALV
jgi:hypothetical protein